MQASSAPRRSGPLGLEGQQRERQGHAGGQRQHGHGAHVQHARLPERVRHEQVGQLGQQ